MPEKKDIFDENEASKLVQIKTTSKGLLNIGKIYDNLVQGLHNDVKINYVYKTKSVQFEPQLHAHFRGTSDRRVMG